MSTQKKSGLGRGLSAILSNPETDITTKDSSGKFTVGNIANIPISQIETNPFQPRDSFEQEALNELSISIREQGIIQPITVRKLGYDKYQLISGERRLRASIMAELKEIPAYIRIANDKEMLEMALIENVAREDLNAIEIAISYNRLIEECNSNTNEICEKLGQNRTTVANYLRLLKLPPELQIAVRDKLITMGHARALINIENPDKQLSILNEILLHDLSVREVEQMARANKQEPKQNAKNKSTFKVADNIVAIQKDIENKLKTKIKLDFKSYDKGAISISFKSQEQLDKILTLLNE